MKKNKQEEIKLPESKDLINNSTKLQIACRSGDLEESLLAGIEPEQEEKTVDQIEEEEFNKQQEQADNKEESTEVSKPEGLDDSFWDEENKSIKQNDLIEAYKKEQEKALGLRRKLSEKGSDKAPKTTDEYVLDESLNELLPNESPTTTLLKEKALEAGLSKDKFNAFLSSVMPALKENGMLADSPLSEEEQEQQFEEYKQAELKKLGDNGPKILQGLANWGHALVNNGVLSKDELPVYNNLLTNAESIAVISKLRALTGEQDIPVKTAVQDGLPSREEIDQLIASKEYQEGNADVHKKVKEYFEATT